MAYNFACALMFVGCQGSLLVGPLPTPTTPYWLLQTPNHIFNELVGGCPKAFGAWLDVSLLYKTLFLPAFNLYPPFTLFSTRSYSVCPRVELANQYPHSYFFFYCFCYFVILFFFFFFFFVINVSLMKYGFAKRLKEKKKGKKHQKNKQVKLKEWIQIRSLMSGGGLT